MKPTRWLGSLCALGAVMLGVRDSQAQGWTYGYFPEPLIVAMDRNTIAGTWESSGGEMAVSARGRFCGRRVG